MKGSSLMTSNERFLAGMKSPVRIGLDRGAAGTVKVVGALRVREGDPPNSEDAFARKSLLSRAIVARYSEDW
jgi:hypothetical protein